MATRQLDVGERTYDRIQAAALELFFDHGFKTTTMREIALACGLTPGALYNHFPSKDALLYSIIKEVHEDLARELDGALAEVGDDPSEQLKAYVRAHARFHTRTRKEARVANQEVLSLPEPQRSEIVEVRRDRRYQLKEILRSGAKTGAFDIADEVVVANAILNMGLRISDWFRPKGKLSADQVSDLHADLALRMVTK